MPKRQFYRNQAETIIKKLELRKMEGYYCENREEAKAKLLELIGEGSKSISYGGSVTLDIPIKLYNINNTKSTI